jgi:hypothetical protein
LSSVISSKRTKSTIPTSSCSAMTPPNCTSTRQPTGRYWLSQLSQLTARQGGWWAVKCDSQACSNVIQLREKKNVPSTKARGNKSESNHDAIENSCRDHRDSWANYYRTQVLTNGSQQMVLDNKL